MTLPHIMIVGIGGTIASQRTDEGFKPSLSVKRLLSYIPEINNHCTFETTQLMNVDSSNLQPEDWEEIANYLITPLNSERFDGIIVLHGTDTMAYTASAVAILIRDVNKPIIFTGSQIPFSVFGSDARRNIIDSIRVIRETDFAESLIVFDSRVYRSVRTTKLREYDLSAFETVDPFPVAEIARRIEIIDQTIKTRSKKKSYFDGPLNPQVALIRIFPGLDPKFLESLSEFGYKGVVIQGYGAGNLPMLNRSLISSVGYLIKQNIAVVITSQCVFGRTELFLYEPGTELIKLGAISGFDMISESAVIKLMWALGKTDELSKISALMQENLVGEIYPFQHKSLREEQQRYSSENNP